METTMDTLVINIQSSTDSATKSIGKLISSLKRLQSELDATIKKSAGLSNLKNIKVGTNFSKSVGSGSGGTKAISQAITPPSKEEQIKSLVGDLSGWDAVSTLKAYNTEIVKYKNNAGQTLTETGKLKKGMWVYNVTLKTVSQTTKTFGEKTRLLAKDFKMISLKAAAIGASLLMMAKRLGGLTELAAQEAEALNLFYVSLGKNAEQGHEWIKKFSGALYLDPVQVMQYMGSFNSLIEGLGVGSENAYKMSKNLTQLVYDLSSFKNISIESSYEKIMSGISGELEPLRNVGVAMSEATLQTLAYELGINRLVREMTEAEKAQLRYIQIMRSSTEWQMDMGRTIIQPANAIRVFRQQVVLMGRAIGKVFIPLLIEVIPYMIAFTQIVSSLAERLAKLFGYEIGDMFNYSDLGDISDGIQDIGDSAEEAANKLNTMLAPFDDLNVVQRQTEKAGSGLSGIGGDLGLDLPEYDALAKLNTKFAENAEKAKKQLEDLIPIVATLGAMFAAWKIGSSIANFMSWWSSLGKDGKTAVSIGFAVGLMFLGYYFIKSGNEDVLNEETLLKGVGEQLFGSAAFGVAAGILTKSIPIGLFIGFSLLGFAGSKTASHGDWKNGLLGFIEQGISVAGIAGIAFKISGGNPLVTLGMAALVTWANVFFNLGELLAMKPTWEEICNAIAELMENSFITRLSEAIGEVFTEFGYKIADGLWVLWDMTREFWKTNVAPIFTKEWWINHVATPIINAFTNTKQDVSNTWNDTWTKVEDTLKTKWTNTKSWLSSHFGTKEDWRRTFSSILDGAASVLNDLKNKFENWSAKIKTPRLEWTQNGIQATGTIKKILETLNLPTSLPKLNVAWYEQGGYPTSGDLFFANENGVPEMIGRIGNQTAVANNDQIATSLTNALLTALNQYDFGGGKSPTIIYIGNRKVYEGYGDYVADENDRYGTNMIHI